MIIQIETTTDSLEIAKQIASFIVDKNLSPCVQVHSINSIYRWNKKIHDSKEFKIKIKTNKENSSHIYKIINQKHNYDIAEIVTSKLEINNDKYLKWFNENVNRK